MEVIDNNEMVVHVREAILLCIEHGIESAQKQLDSYDRSKKLATNQKVTLKLNLECIVE